MKIKLVSPRATMRPMDSLWKVHMAPPLGLLVVGALTPERHEVSLCDENVERPRFDDAPDLVGISVKVDAFCRAAEIASHYRARGIPVVMGGIHATARPEDCLRFADAVVIGEAEGLWPQVVEDAARGELRPVYRHAQPASLDETPVPRWELLRGKDYLFTNTLCAGRGCPWRCDFCYNSSPNIDARHRMKSVPQTLGEIRSLGVKHVMFIDDNFIGHPEKAAELMRALRPLNLTWHAAVSADIGRREDLLDLMAESGCRSLFIGFESINPDSLRACHKSQNRVEDYERTLALIHRRGIMVNASLVFGFDTDGPEVFDATKDWLVRNRIATMTAHLLTPYPGTRLHARMESEGRIVDRDLRHYNTATAVFRPMRMTCRELEQGLLSIYREFYSWPNMIRRRPAHPRQRIAYWEFNLLYRKYGALTSRIGKTLGMRRLARLAKAVAYPARRHLPDPNSPRREGGVDGVRAFSLSWSRTRRDSASARSCGRN